MGEGRFLNHILGYQAWLWHQSRLWRQERVWHQGRCCSRAGRLLRNDVLLGNKFANVASQQECCNMCTNHPHCTAWEYTATKVCALTGGKPQFVPSPSQTIATWAGLPSPHSCAPFDGSGEVSVAATASV